MNFATKKENLRNKFSFLVLEIKINFSIENPLLSLELSLLE